MINQIRSMIVEGFRNPATRLRYTLYACADIVIWFAIIVMFATKMFSAAISLTVGYILLFVALGGIKQIRWFIQNRKNEVPADEDEEDNEIENDEPCDCKFCQDARNNDESE